MLKYSGTGEIGHIFESDSQVVTNLVMVSGKEIPTHRSPFTVVVVPVKGRIIFKGEDFEEEIFPGVIVRMDPHEDHSLIALEDSELMVIKSELK